MKVKIDRSYIESVFHYITVELGDKTFEVQAITDEYEIRDIFYPKDLDLTEQQVEILEQKVLSVLNKANHPNLEISMVVNNYENV